MLSPRQLTIPAVVLAVATLALAACSNGTGAEGGAALSVSVTTGPQSPSNAPTARAAALVLTKAQVVIRKIELEKVNSDTACVDDDDDEHMSGGPGGSNSGSGSGHGEEDEDECDEVEIGPFLFDLPLDGSTKTDFTALVPEGTFREVEVKIGRVRSGNMRALTFLTQHPEFKDISLRVEGTLDGKAFVFESAVDVEIEREFEPPITIGAGSTANITVAIDVASWFSDGAGGVLDPSLAANAERIKANIRKSLRAFRDDDCDGHEDHGH
jgi:hypothetical protein